MPDSAAKRFGADLRPYLDMLFRSAYRLLGNRDDAEDLVQDTCLRAFDKAKAFARAESPLNWLMRVQYNLFVDEARRKQRAPVAFYDDRDLSETASDRSADPESRVFDEQRMQLVQNAFMKLNKDQRALLALRIEGYSLAEMQEITGLDVDALNARLYRARQSLARHYRKDADGIVPPQQMESRR